MFGRTAFTVCELLHPNLLSFYGKECHAISKLVTISMTKRTRFSKSSDSDSKVKVTKLGPEISPRVVGTESAENISVTRNSKVNAMPEVVTCCKHKETPTKSPSDKKEYRVIKLENGVTALLISDTTAADVEDLSQAEDDTGGAYCSSQDSEDDVEEEELIEEEQEEEIEDEALNTLNTEDEIDGRDSKLRRQQSKKGVKMAAAGVCIGVGSFSDPLEVPGLAHFLEHMVFMGSKKYCQENSFDAFIKKHGGSDNASTDCETTTFYFEVQEKYFQEGLDRFSQFFKEPLMKQESMQREREAVDSEFHMAITSDHFRKQQLLGSFAREGHPVGKFMFGNLRTLKSDDIPDAVMHKKLHQFRNQYYCGQYMTIAVQSREVLEVLEQWVQKYFSGVPNSGMSRESYHNLTQPFDTSRFNKIYKIVPVRNVHKVELTWALPSLLHEYQVKPLHYISWLIGYESKGSLLSYLRKRVWAFDLTTGNDESGFEHNSTYAIYNISITLTDSGFHHLDEVLRAVFSYIKMLQKIGPQERTYLEIQKIEDINFQYVNETPPVEYVETLCENMHYFPSVNYITGDTLMYQYDPKVIDECQKALLPEKVNIMVFSKEFEKQKICDKREPWFNTEYTVEDIPAEWLTAWQTLVPDSEFHIPEPNRFIAEDFNICTPDRETTKYPVLIVQDRNMEMWYKKDIKFNQPRAHFSFYLISPLLLQSPDNAAMMDLFVGLLCQYLVEDVYPANVAQLEYSLYSAERGIILKIYGFNDKLPLLLETILQHIADCEKNFNEDMFAAVKAQQMKAYYNHFLKPSKLNRDMRLAIIQEVYWTPVEKYKVIESITMDMVTAFSQQFKSHIYICSLVQGNITAQHAVNLSQLVRNKLNCELLSSFVVPEIRVAQIPLGEKCCSVRSFNKKDPNTVVTNYYQAGPGDIRTVCILEILLMLMEEPAFDVLRTQEQLGYHVSAAYKNTLGILGFSITVNTQADKFSASYIDQQIDAFLEKFCKTLDCLVEEEFSSTLASVIKMKEKADINLVEEVNRNWAEITGREFLFDRLEKEVETLQNITLQEVQEFLQKQIARGCRTNFRKLSVQVVGLATASDTKIKMQAEDARDSDQEDGNTEDDAVETDIKAEYPLQFLSDQDKPKEFFINDIESYKAGLTIFPVIKITC